MASTTTHSAAASTPARCLSGNLKVTLGRSDGAAGSIFYPLKFKNVGTKVCSLHGFPGVSAMRNGHQVGVAAAWTRSGRRQSS
ncbi:MAG TPA: DUF4232 domain-containing protein [Mycobacterium sp.]|nr:DUF4232 domain-containing protein [Mycobacterium sp.]